MQPSRINQTHPPRPKFYTDALYDAGYTPDRTPEGHEQRYQARLTIARSAEPNSDLAKAVAYDLAIHGQSLIKRKVTNGIQRFNNCTLICVCQDTHENQLSHAPHQNNQPYHLSQNHNQTTNHDLLWLNLVKEQPAAPKQPAKAKPQKPEKHQQPKQTPPLSRRRSRRQQKDSLKTTTH